MGSFDTLFQKDIEDAQNFDTIFGGLADGELIDMVEPSMFYHESGEEVYFDPSEIDTPEEVEHEHSILDVDYEDYRSIIEGETNDAEEFDDLHMEGDENLYSTPNPEVSSIGPSVDADLRYPALPETSQEFEDRLSEYDVDDQYGYSNPDDIDDEGNDIDGDAPSYDECGDNCRREQYDDFEPDDHANASDYNMEFPSYGECGSSYKEEGDYGDEYFDDDSEYEEGCDSCRKEEYDDYSDEDDLYGESYSEYYDDEELSFDEAYTDEDEFNVFAESDVASKDAEEEGKLIDSVASVDDNPEDDSISFDDFEYPEDVNPTIDIHGELVANANGDHTNPDFSLESTIYDDFENEANYGIGTNDGIGENDGIGFNSGLDIEMDGVDPSSESALEDGEDIDKLSEGSDLISLW